MTVGGLYFLLFFCKIALIFKYIFYAPIAFSNTPKSFFFCLIFQHDSVQYLTAVKVEVDNDRAVPLTQLNAPLTKHKQKELSGEEQRTGTRLQLHIVQLYVSVMFLHLELCVYFWFPQKG